MRHVLGLEGWEEWREGDGVAGLEEEGEVRDVDWKGFLEGMREDGGGDEVEDEGDGKQEGNSEDEMIDQAEESSGDEEYPDEADSEDENSTEKYITPKY